MKFKISYKVNTKNILNPSELRSSYLFGIGLHSNGQSIQDSDVMDYIDAAQEQVEKYLDIKIKKEVYSENLSFYVDDFQMWGYIPSSYPVLKPISAEGFYNEIRQITFPKEWLACKKSSDSQVQDRSIYLIPAGSLAGPSTNAIVYNALFPQMNFLSQKNIPYYWRIRYVVGYDRIPRDIMNVIGKLASINVLSILGNLLYGAGVSNVSLGLDGLSQSFGTTKSANSHAFSGLVNQYYKELETSLPRLKDFYKGLALTSC